ncbi:MAG: carboxy-S-adenosyl-L-methionine synthase CmoA [Proteobacteria bacterium]|nr:carboxy-S-adenosyl-L-methionine synthase CmoA [Pseudomonadota bacterium]MBU1544307.1 carboxy-S-adenosyl-L-methionine synthase CmoA [Pseudomonadota bacterium]MBU2431470.1 carboxy-S-adenosyl-L-methionine synthase CmoA [Pseudomonadota bacterium]MBU2480951.1 carboxy-S-adenosyl-L-methionine synthase CmoA [Pseudomonadota bacterium]
MKKDRIFASGRAKIEPFKFTEQVAQVFDDMLHRSVPLYAESIYRQSQLAAQYYQDGSQIYDLGCSNGNLGVKVMEQFKDTPFSMTGVDNSWPMIEKYLRRLKKYTGPGRVNLLCAPMEHIKFKNASVVLINLTLQFLEKQKRDALIKDIYNGMNPGGIFILTEKTIHEDTELEDLRTRFYKMYKRENGYSELEISQKRDALEKVLIPETVDTHYKRIKDAGFSCCDIWLKWFNFTSMIAIK